MSSGQEEIGGRPAGLLDIAGALANKTRRVRQLLGIDRAIFFTVISRGWSALAGPITLLCVAQFLSAEEQGFFYTFSSILGLQLFFELGLAYVIMQIVSHEAAHLQWSSSGTLEGDARAKARLASIFMLSVRWYAVVAVAVVLVLSVAGLAFFESSAPQAAAAQWRTPWLLLTCFTAVTLLLTPAYGVLEGSGKIAEIARLNAMQAVAASSSVWIALACGWRLYAAPAVAFSTAVVGSFWLWRNHRRFFFDLMRTRADESDSVNWRTEILPFQWRIALSWLSGYFIFHLANPVIFRYHGAVEAGKMGMTMRIIDSINALAFAWISTKSAPFGMLIARRDFATLDATFRRAAIQSVSVVAVGGATFVVGYHVLAAAGLPLIGRLLDPLPTYFLVGSSVVSCIVFAQAVYLRAHKAEPFLSLSLVSALMSSAIVYFLGRPYGTLGIAAGVFASGLSVGLPLASWIFYNKRREWH